MKVKPTYEELETRVQELEKLESEHNYSKEALRESEKLFKRLYEKAPLGYQSLDENGHFMVVNQTWLDTLGYTKEEVIGKSFADFLHPGWRDHFSENFPRFKSIGEILGVEFEMVKKNGDLILVSFTGKISRDKNGDFQQTHCIFHDITERKRHEDELRMARELSARIIEDGPVAITLVDRDGKIVFANRHAERLFGLKKADIEAFGYNSPEWLIVDVDGSPFPDERLPFRQVMSTGQAIYNVQHAIIRPNAARKILSINGAPLHDEQGRIERVVFVILDITERKRAEKEREKLQAQLNQAQKMESVGRLAGGVAHDFNNMLGVILGHTEMALEEIDPAAPLYASLQAVQLAAERSAALTRQLLTFARKQTVAPKVIDLNETVEGMLKMLRRLIGEDINLLWQPGRNLQPVKIDPSQIDQLLANLCVNARDAIVGGGKIAIETDAKTFDEAYCTDHLGFLPGEYVLLEVSDDGCGMDKKTLNHIFEPFFTTKEHGKGTGLGLASVFGMVKQNNGFINVYSEPGKGTTFKIYLPAYAVKSAGVVEMVPDLPTERGHETILLVEDEPTILNMTTMMLTRLGYTVVAAATPGEAIRLAHEYRGRIDLLMTDVVMPEMNGRELAGNLLSYDPDLKRLFMSGYTANVIANHGVLDEGVRFIQKPFSMKELGGKLREALGN